LFLGLAVGVIVATALIEWMMGRLPFGPDGRFGLWEGNIWSPGCSQRVADAYAFSHIIHGMFFYMLLWLMARRLPISARYLLAVLLEAGWELLENSPIIINRYRESTMALGYSGDSILNSTSDVLMMSLGFFLAWKLRPGVTVALVLIMEIGCLFWIRDNLTLNVLMLVRPIEAVKRWQMDGRPNPEEALRLDPNRMFSRLSVARQAPKPQGQPVVRQHRHGIFPDGFGRVFHDRPIDARALQSVLQRHR
jgi:hypothetical protein